MSGRHRAKRPDDDPYVPVPRRWEVWWLVIATSALGVALLLPRLL